MNMAKQLRLSSPLYSQACDCGQACSDPRRSRTRNAITFCKKEAIFVVDNEHRKVWMSFGELAFDVVIVRAMSLIPQCFASSSQQVRARGIAEAGGPDVEM
tara:strand:+ start:1565 stop:1867 length:303 start_codon:yes stop_codon:yes gene_type:complete